MSRTRNGAGAGQSNTSVHLLLLLMAAIWGVNIPVSKSALHEMSPLAFTGLRVLLCQATLVGIQLVRRQPIWVRAKDTPRLVAVGVIGCTGYQLLFIEGVARTTANKSSLILAAVPVIVAILGTLAGVERLGLRGWIGAAACFAGVVIVSVAGGLDYSQGGWIGDAMMIGAALAWAASTVISRPLFRSYDPGVVTAGSMMAGMLATLPLTLMPLLKQDWGTVSLAGWSGLLYTALMASAIANIIYYIGVDRVGGARTTVYNNVTPLFAIIASRLLLGESFSPVQALGAGIISVGLRLTQTDHAPPPRRIEQVAASPAAGGAGGE